MRSIVYGLFGLLVTGSLLSCVDPEAIDLVGTVDVVVVDGLLSTLTEEQLIRLNRSRADPYTGRFGTRPITKATVQVLVDSAQVVDCHETIDGSYQLPSDFRAQPGHAYQLRFTLSDGTQYRSNQQVIPPIVGIDKVSARFNSRSLSVPINQFFTAGHDLSVDFTDPANQRNYYRWDWKLYEKQDWCASCYQGIYSIYGVTATLLQTGSNNIYLYRSDNRTLLEACFAELPPPAPSQRSPLPEYRYDYTCRTNCWEIIYSHTINVFDDQLSNGGVISGRPVAQIPYYVSRPALVEIRQSSLTADAYRYFRLFQQQTQNAGGLADTPPTALAGNVHNLANEREVVVGYFAAVGTATQRYWLDRRDAVGRALGDTDPAGPSGQSGADLYYALNLRQPNPEPVPPLGYPQIDLIDSPPRPPTALCVPSESKTPNKPEGWRD